MSEAELAKAMADIVASDPELQAAAAASQTVERTEVIATAAPAPKPSAPKQLGKGLGALLGEQTIQAVEKGEAQQKMPVSRLQPSTVQPRKYFDKEALEALSQSIKSQGVLTPLLVRAVPGGTPGQYEIVAGERRWRASQQAGLTEVPVIVLELDDAKALEVALVENVQRADLNPIDEADGYLRLVNEFGYTHEEMSRVTGKSRSHITNLLRLLSLPERIKECVQEGQLSMGHARALLGLADDEPIMLRAAAKVMKVSMSVRETEELVRSLASPNKSSRGRRPKDTATQELEQRIAENLGYTVSVSQKEGSGSLKIFFENADQFKQLLGKLGIQ